MKSKFLIIGILFFGLLAGGIYFSYETFNKPIETKEFKDSPFSIWTKNEVENFTETTEWYETKIDYPKNNQKVRDLVFNIYEDYLKETGVKTYTDFAQAKEGLQINVEGLKYAFMAEYKIATSSNTISYVYKIYNFTGGAHGGTTVNPITFNENQEIVPIEQILPETKLAAVAKLAETDLRKQKSERMKSYGNMSAKEIEEYLKDDDFLSEGIKPTRDNYSAAWFDGDNIVIVFQQYQVGPYAEGIYEVKIPKNSL